MARRRLPQERSPHRPGGRRFLDGLVTALVPPSSDVLASPAPHPRRDRTPRLLVHLLLPGNAEVPGFGTGEPSGTFADEEVPPTRLSLVEGSLRQAVLGQEIGRITDEEAPELDERYRKRLARG